MLNKMVVAFQVSTGNVEAFPTFGISLPFVLFCSYMDSKCYPEHLEKLVLGMNENHMLHFLKIKIQFF